MTGPQRVRPLLLVTALAAWLVGVPLAHAGVPWALSRLGPRYGWSDGGAGAANALGLATVVAGGAFLLWVMTTHFARSREWTSLEIAPRYVLAEGPYSYSRNPMYVGELALWLGWALFYGSPVLLAASAVLAFGMTRAIRREERTLEARFGERYLAYKRRVRRWLGIRR